MLHNTRAHTFHFLFNEEEKSIFLFYKWNKMRFVQNDYITLEPKKTKHFLTVNKRQNVVCFRIWILNHYPTLPLIRPKGTIEKRRCDIFYYIRYISGMLTAYTSVNRRADWCGHVTFYFIGYYIKTFDHRI